MTRCKKICLVKKNIFQNLYTIKSYISTHQSSIRGYNLAYDHTPKHMGGIISQGVYFRLLHWSQEMASCHLRPRVVSWNNGRYVRLVSGRYATKYYYTVSHLVELRHELINQTVVHT